MRFLIGPQGLAEQFEMAEADGAKLQSAQQRRAKSPMLPAIGDRDRELPASLLAVEIVTRLSDDGIAPLIAQFRDQRETIRLPAMLETVKRDLGDIADRTHEAVVARGVR